MNKGMRIGYARVSSSGQKLDLQLERFKGYVKSPHEEYVKEAF